MSSWLCGLGLGVLAGGDRGFVGSLSDFGVSLALARSMALRTRVSSSRLLSQNLSILDWRLIFVSLSPKATPASQQMDTRLSLRLMG